MSTLKQLIGNTMHNKLSPKQLLAQHERKREMLMAQLKNIDGQIEHAKRNLVWKPKAWPTAATVRISCPHMLVRQTDEDVRMFANLVAYRNEFAPGFMYREGQKNWFVFKRNTDWCADFSVARGVPTVYFPEQIAKDLARKLNEGEVVL